MNGERPHRRPAYPRANSPYVLLHGRVLPPGTLCPTTSAPSLILSSSENCWNHTISGELLIYVDLSNGRTINFWYDRTWSLLLTPIASCLLHCKKGSPYSITEHRVPELSHKPDGRLPLLSARPAVTLATLNRAAINFAAWWTEEQWVWTVCLRLLPDSVATAIWTQALLRLSPAR